MPTYKDEKTGLWYCKFVYTDWMGQKKQKKKMGFRLQKEAKQFELDFLSKNAQSCDIRFCDLIEIYMDDCKARLKPTTYKGKQDVLEKHIIPYFKNFKVNEIQAMTVRRWQTELINDPKKYKPTYLRTLNSQLSAIFNFAVKYYGLPYNPVQRSGPMGKKKSDLMQFWKPDEFQLFIEAVSDKVMSKVIFNLLYWTGMRSGELLALTLNDFDFEERTVSINKNFARVDGEDLFLEPKTPKSRRKITLPQFVCDMVKDYADKLYGYDPSDRLFEITKHYLKSEMERGCKKTGVRLIRVHDIRHSHASLLIEMGFTPLLISERLGHESAVITLGTYAHLYPDKQNEVAARLESFA
ncbi:MAG: site-specific integrase [Clostridia bacterium]|nr:site-specific integrase [Tyzzerella sp.]MBQ6707262.1 site-specific integrase [Clostridia bacterium]